MPISPSILLACSSEEKTEQAYSFNLPNNIGSTKSMKRLVCRCTICTLLKQTERLKNLKEDDNPVILMIK